MTSPWGAPKGLSWLDLYSMGLVGPEDVPETFYISSASPPDSTGMRHGGVPVPVTIADVRAANGTQRPKPPQPLRFQIYVLHENDREVDPKAMTAAREMEVLVGRYFGMATQGRLTVVPTR